MERSGVQGGSPAFSVDAGFRRSFRPGRGRGCRIRQCRRVRPDRLGNGHVAAPPRPIPLPRRLGRLRLRAGAAADLFRGRSHDGSFVHPVRRALAFRSGSVSGERQTGAFLPGGVVRRSGLADPLSRHRFARRGGAPVVAAQGRTASRTHKKRRGLRRRLDGAGLLVVAVEFSKWDAYRTKLPERLQAAGKSASGGRRVSQVVVGRIRFRLAGERGRCHIRRQHRKNDYSRPVPEYRGVDRPGRRNGIRDPPAAASGVLAKLEDHSRPGCFRGGLCAFPGNRPSAWRFAARQSAPGAALRSGSGCGRGGLERVPALRRGEKNEATVWRRSPPFWRKGNEGCDSGGETRAGVSAQGVPLPLAGAAGFRELRQYTRPHRKRFVLRFQAMGRLRGRPLLEIAAARRLHLEHRCARAVFPGGSPAGVPRPQTEHASLRRRQTAHMAL